MNVYKKALKLNEYNSNFPEFEIGKEIELKDLWDGTGEPPEHSWSIPLSEMDWINYRFIILKKCKNDLQTLIRIAGVELL